MKYILAPILKFLVYILLVIGTITILLIRLIWDPKEIIASWKKEREFYKKIDNGLPYYLEKDFWIIVIWENIVS